VIKCEDSWKPNGSLTLANRSNFCKYFQTRKVYGLTGFLAIFSGIELAAEVRLERFCFSQFLETCCKSFIMRILPFGGREAAPAPIGNSSQKSLRMENHSTENSEEPLKGKTAPGRVWHTIVKDKVAFSATPPAMSPTKFQPPSHPLKPRQDGGGRCKEVSRLPEIDRSLTRSTL
jgi:hypothetical protein